MQAKRINWTCIYSKKTLDKTRLRLTVTTLTLCITQTRLLMFL